MHCDSTWPWSLPSLHRSSPVHHTLQLQTVPALRRPNNVRSAAKLTVVHGPAERRRPAVRAVGGEESHFAISQGPAPGHLTLATARPPRTTAATVPAREVNQSGTGEAVVARAASRTGWSRVG